VRTRSSAAELTEFGQTKVTLAALVEDLDVCRREERRLELGKIDRADRGNTGRFQRGQQPPAITANLE
jgi:hypothetical protein